MMSPFRYFLVLSTLLLTLNAQAQWRLLYHAQDMVASPNTIASADSAHRITLIERRGSLSHKLIVHYNQGKRRLVNRKDIWGYVDGDGRIWRSYGTDDFTLVAHKGHWIEYLLTRVFTSRNGGARVSQSILYSRTLESPIREHWNDAMADAPVGFVVGPTKRMQISY